MKIQTMSLVAGTDACNARCPFCVAGMTGEIGAKPVEVNTRNLWKAVRLAKASNVTTVLITGKGEPTLFPDQIDTYLDFTVDFPMTELQTNGIPIADGKISDDKLREWYGHGLTTIIISVVSYDPEVNRRCYLPSRSSYIDLPKLIDKLHEIGFCVRLGVVATKDGISNSTQLVKMLNFCRDHGVEQLTVRPVTEAKVSGNLDINKYVQQNQPKWGEIQDWVRIGQRTGTLTLLHKLVHGAAVFDFLGQNLCISNCLTLDPDEETIRQIIFYPSGRVMYDWVHKGAILF